MTLHISPEQARRFLALYHFAPTNLPGVLERLGTVQYDPLNPVGRNPDLVFQARVADYRVDDWQQAAYTDRLIYDSWDKQACLVPISDWPMRALIREKYQPYHDREILQSEAEVAASILATIDEQGPLSSHEFEDRSQAQGGHSWFGQTRTKRVLRSLWVGGTLVTHHRKNGRHYYDRAQRVIPAQYFNAQPLLDELAYHRWIILRRHQATGILRKTADASIWSGCGAREVCDRATAQLVEEGTLTLVRIGEKPWLYYMPTAALKLLDAPSPPPRMIFLGPLDSILWDRKGILHIFDFDYIWEVYKPEKMRKWGYYILPVFYGDRFIARLDSRLEKGIWTISRWWWEPSVRPNAELLDALRVAVAQFSRYLRAHDVRVCEDGVDVEVRQAIENK